MERCMDYARRPTVHGVELHSVPVSSIQSREGGRYIACKLFGREIYSASNMKGSSSDQKIIYELFCSSISVFVKQCET